MAQVGQAPGVHVARGSDRADAEIALPRRVVLQFRVVANSVWSSAHRPRQNQTVGDRKLLALSAIAHMPGLGVNALALTLGVRQPTASQVVKALAASHLITVRRDDLDRRAVRIHATLEGLAVVRELPPSFDFGNRLPLALGLLRPGELCRLESGLAELLDALPPVNRNGDSGGKGDGA